MLNILIIDDNIKLRRQIKRILVSTLPFLRIAEASDEREAFLEIEKHRPQLVIMDIHLAAENGLTLTKMIKTQYPFIPIAINTSNDTPEYKSAADEVGAEYFLSKKTNTINDLAGLAESIYFKKTCEPV